MARKHNTQHNRGKSRYPMRLKARSMNNVSVRMESLETLRKRQSGEEANLLSR